MADRTAIEWTATVNADGSTTPGATWNPTRGCSRVSPGCGGPGPHGGCYAEIVAARFSGAGQPYEGLAHRVGGKPRWTGKVKLIESMLDQPLRWKRPRRIFVNSMSDPFHESLPDDAIDRVFAVMALAPQHTFMVLTKRAERMASYCASPALPDRISAKMWEASRRGTDHIHGGYPLSNCWLGVSVEDQERADERIPLLLQTPAAVRFLSCEPLIGPVDLREYLIGTEEPGLVGNCIGWTPPLDWVIAGSESGPRARPCDLEWVRGIRDQCSAAGVAFFWKQHVAAGRKISTPELDGRRWVEFPEADGAVNEAPR